MKTLNEKGQCPVCLIKPIVYKGLRSQRGKFCWRCDRLYDLDTGNMITNWAWNADGTPLKRI